MDNLRWLGLFSAEPISTDSVNATAALVNLLTRRLTLPPDGRDLIILHHVLEARFPEESGADNSRRRILSTLLEYGEPGGITAMARTVGLPSALATQLLLEGALDLSGCHIPTEPRIYKPVLAALESEGIEFSETVTGLDRTRPGAVESTAREGNS
jgi:saccharopine dehydrogenase (NADP+, L-glutamate forming)